MSFENFAPMIDGTVPGRDYPQIVVPLGNVRVPSGKLMVADPQPPWGGCVVPVSPGEFPVWLTISDLRSRVSNYFEPAYLSVILSEDPAERLAFMTSSDVIEDPEDGPTIGPLAIGITGGVIAVVDGDAAARLDGDIDWDAVLEADGESPWLSVIDAETARRLLCRNIPLPGATRGENSVEAEVPASVDPSASGEEVVPLVGAYGTDGRLVGVHAALEGTFGDWHELERAAEKAEKQKRPGFFSRLFG